MSGRYYDLEEGERRGYGPMYRAARRLADRGVFDASEITAWPDEKEPSIDTPLIGKNDILDLPFHDGTYKDVYYELKGEDVYLVTYDHGSKLYVQEVQGASIPKLGESGVCDLAVRKDGVLFVFTIKRKTAGEMAWLLTTGWARKRIAPTAMVP
jgi:hypothetical protein